MTIVRVVFALHSRPGGTTTALKSGVPAARLAQHLIVLVDDAGQRAVPLWLRVRDAKPLRHLLDRPAGDGALAGGLQETAARLLDAAGAAVTAVDIEPADAAATELCWDTVITLAELATAAGTRHVPVSAAYGLALAAAAGAPVRVPEEVLDRLAVPVPGEDATAAFRPQRPARPPQQPDTPQWRHRFEPRNLEFADGLAYWDLGKADNPEGQDYSCSPAERAAVLTAAVPNPVGSAALVQTIYADDYRGRTVIFRGQLRTTDIANRAGLHLTAGRPGETLRDGGASSLAPGGSTDWTWHEATVTVGTDAAVIRFGISLTGPGRVELRNAELIPAPPGTRE